ncbi:MAG TPA: hypothetical protein VF334_16490 [Polyangia bacterium]
MDRLLVAASILIVGCSSSAPHRLVGGDAVLSAVSVDQKWVAVLTGTTRLGTGAHVGTLQLAPASGGTPMTLDDRSSGGVFNRGTTLWYLGGVTVVSEGTPPSDHVYGALYVWTPALGAPIKVGNDVREYYVSQDGTTSVFFDWASPTIDAANTGTLTTVHAPSCSAAGCSPIVIAENTTLAATSWRIALDGEHVLATVRGAAATDPGKVVLVAHDSGAMQILSTGVNARAAMMTPAGDTVAWVEGENEIHVPPSAGGAATVIVPSAPIVDSAQMIDPTSFIARTRELATGPAALVKVTAAATTPLPVAKPQQYFVSQAVPGATDRYVFFQLATIAANGEPDLWMLDHTTPGAQPVQLGAAVDSPIAGAVSFSDDGTMIEYFDNFDPVTRRGDEYIMPLAHPTRSLVATGVHNAAFIPGTTRLMYISAPDPVTGAGVLSTLSSPTALADVQSVGIVNFADPRDAPARTWYTQTTGAPDDGVWSMPQP